MHLIAIIHEHDYGNDKELNKYLNASFYSKD